VFGGSRRPAGNDGASGTGSGKHAPRVGSHLRLEIHPGAAVLYLDDTLDHVDRINTLIKKIHDELTVSSRFAEGELLLVRKPAGWTSFDVVHRIEPHVRH